MPFKSGLPSAVRGAVYGAASPSACGRAEVGKSIQAAKPVMIAAPTTAIQVRIVPPSLLHHGERPHRSAGRDDVGGIAVRQPAAAPRGDGHVLPSLVHV